MFGLIINALLISLQLVPTSLLSMQRMSELLRTSLFVRWTLHLLNLISEFTLSSPVVLPNHLISPMMPLPTLWVFLCIRVTLHREVFLVVAIGLSLLRRISFFTTRLTLLTVSTSKHSRSLPGLFHSSLLLMYLSLLREIGIKTFTASRMRGLRVWNGV